MVPIPSTFSVRHRERDENFQKASQYLLVAVGSVVSSNILQLLTCALDLFILVNLGGHLGFWTQKQPKTSSQLGNLVFLAQKGLP